MNRQELAEYVCSRSSLSRKAASEMVDIVLDGIMEGVEKDGITRLPGFGLFSLKKRAERQGRNPKTGLPMTIKAKVTPAFSPGSVFKTRIS